MNMEFMQLVTYSSADVNIFLQKCNSESSPLKIKKIEDIGIENPFFDKLVRLGINSENGYDVANLIYSSKNSAMPFSLEYENIKFPEGFSFGDINLYYEVVMPEDPKSGLYSLKKELNFLKEQRLPFFTVCESVEDRPPLFLVGYNLENKNNKIYRNDAVKEKGLIDLIYGIK